MKTRSSKLSATEEQRRTVISLYIQFFGHMITQMRMIDDEKKKLRRPTRRSPRNSPHSSHPMIIAQDYIMKNVQPQFEDFNDEAKQQALTLFHETAIDICTQKEKQGCNGCEEVGQRWCSCLVNNWINGHVQSIREVSNSENLVFANIAIEKLNLVRMKKPEEASSQPIIINETSSDSISQTKDVDHNDKIDSQPSGSQNSRELERLKIWHFWEKQLEKN